VSPEETSTNRILVVDDDAMLIGEYIKCLGADFEPDVATSTLGDLEKVLFGEETDERGAARFDVQSRNQGEAAVEASGCRRALTVSMRRNRFVKLTRISILSSLQVP
jgi:hypothetical protein